MVEEPGEWGSGSQRGETGQESKQVISWKLHLHVWLSYTDYLANMVI